MSKRSSRPYDPYSQKRNIRVPYTYLPRAAVKKQDRRFWGVGVPAIVLAFATILLAGIAQESASLTAVCGLLSPAALVGFILLDRHATRHTWWCIFSRAEVKFYLAKGERLYRARYKQENQQAGVVITFIFMAIVAILAVVMAVMNLTGQSLDLTGF